MLSTISEISMFLESTYVQVCVCWLADKINVYFKHGRVGNEARFPSPQAFVKSGTTGLPNRFFHIQCDWALIR